MWFERYPVKMWRFSVDFLLVELVGFLLYGVAAFMPAKGRVYG